VNARLTDHDLRAAWRAAETATPGTGACPSPEALWDAARGSLDHDALRRVLDHVAACGTCAEAWRVAVDIAGGEALPLAGRTTPASVEHPAGSGAPRLRWLGVAAAAVVALGLGVALYPWRPSEPAVYRDREESAVRSLVADGAALPRDAFDLQWEGPPDAAEYDLRVTTADLRLVDVQRRLDTPRHQVPAGALAGLPDGTHLFWQVTATLETGEREISPTFSVEIAPAEPP